MRNRSTTVLGFSALAFVLAVTACADTDARAIIRVSGEGHYEVTLDEGRRLTVDDFEILLDGVPYGTVESGQKVELFQGGERHDQIHVDGERRESSGS